MISATSISLSRAKTVDVDDDESSTRSGVRESARERHTTAVRPLSSDSSIGWPWGGSICSSSGTSGGGGVCSVVSGGSSLDVVESASQCSFSEVSSPPITRSRSFSSVHDMLPMPASSSSSETPYRRYSYSTWPPQRSTFLNDGSSTENRDNRSDYNHHCSHITSPFGIFSPVLASNTPSSGCGGRKSSVGTDSDVDDSVSCRDSREWNPRIVAVGWAAQSDSGEPDAVEPGVLDDGMKVVQSATAKPSAKGGLKGILRRARSAYGRFATNATRTRVRRTRSCSSDSGSFSHVVLSRHKSNSGHNMSRETTLEEEEGNEEEAGNEEETGNEEDEEPHKTVRFHTTVTLDHTVSCGDASRLSDGGSHALVMMNEETAQVVRQELYDYKTGEMRVHRASVRNTSVPRLFHKVV